MIINKYILYIYLIHVKCCSATKGFMKFITTFIRKLRRWTEIKNRKCDKIQTKAVRISFMCGCKYLCVYGCGFIFDFRLYFVAFSIFNSIPSS